MAKIDIKFMKRDAKKLPIGNTIKPGKSGAKKTDKKK